MKRNVVKQSVSMIMAVLLFLGAAGVNAPVQVHAQQKSEAVSETALKPIIIQAPMPIEGEHFAQRLKHVKVEKSGSFIFWIGTLDDYPVIVMKTGKGMENSAAATAIAIERYHPIAIINQGTSGGHDASLNVYDIVLGRRTTNIGSFKTPELAEGKGSDPMKWIPMDLLASEGSAGEDPNAEKIRYFDGDQKLLAAANAVKHKYTKGKVVEGTIGSADTWNNEIDRIKWFHEKFGTSVEEMEGASAAQIAGSYNVPLLVIRILSNNKVNQGKYNPNTAAANQEYVFEVVKQYISMIK
ncbi:5'-methylthioadenosine/S-adenosylhomocysteine nucleosidase [Niallia oryzisoli]|uniref:5'-methylthioadenosine/S-adenosylhomocysteine nucleosidase n=1 Tax=Niallia oryzisoli TaxID=1737571 RepID=UPI003735482F